MKDKEVKQKSVKNLLIEQIQAIQDEPFLNALKVLTDSKVREESKKEPEQQKGNLDKGKYQLSGFEYVKLRPAQKQYATEDTTPHEKVKQDIEAWLKSK